MAGVVVEKEFCLLLYLCACEGSRQLQGLLGLVDVVLDVIDSGEVAQIMSLWHLLRFKHLPLHKLPGNT